jgi:hypothetical protein
MKVYTKRGTSFLIDKDDYNILLSEGYTFMSSGGYVLAYKDRKRTMLHRLLMSPGSDKEVDHINRNGKDNRRSNLRVCSHQENCFNKTFRKTRVSKYQGVRRNANKKRWQAYIMKDRTFYHLGIFDCETEAARAYDNKAKELFGEFARVNNVN